MYWNNLLYLILIVTICSCNKKGSVTEVPEANGRLVIDGIANEKSWTDATWKVIDQKWLGPEYSSSDFNGRYKLTWDGQYLYVLAEIEDDTLIDIYTNNLEHWWDDDCLEIFVDENRSKGDHQYSHNAFAYHVALNNDVVDIGPDHKPHLYNKDVVCKRITNGNKSTWEVAIAIHHHNYIDNSPNNIPLVLNSGKKLGFAIAYCDNDHSLERENFIGSEKVEGDDKNRGWIDAGVFGEIELVK